jgi:hypothetical protein
METSIQIRAIEDGDFDRWKPLWDGYNKFYGRHGETALPLEATLTTWSRFLNGAEPMQALVAEKDGELIGLAHFLYHRSTSQIGLSCYLQDERSAIEDLSW